MLSVVLPLFGKVTAAKMGDFVKLLEGHMTRRQIRVGIQKFVDVGILVSEGTGAGTRYSLSETYKERTKILDEALIIGLKEIARREWPTKGQETGEKEGGKA